MSALLPDLVDVTTDSGDRVTVWARRFGDWAAHVKLYHDIDKPPVYMVSHLPTGACCDTVLETDDFDLACAVASALDASGINAFMPSSTDALTTCLAAGSEWMTETRFVLNALVAEAVAKTESAEVAA